MPHLLRTALIIMMTGVFCSGCWDRDELDNLSIVAGFGVDQTETGDNQLLLTAQIIKPTQRNTTKTAVGGSGPGFWTDQSSGQTIFEGIRNFAFKNNRRLYFAHNRVLVISKPLALGGLYPIIDIFVRDPEIRPNLFVLIAKGKAGDILEVKTELEAIPAFAIADMIQTSGNTSKIIPVSLQQFTMDLTSKTKAPVLPLIEIISDDRQEKTLHLNGTAVFKRDRLVGELNKDETRGLLWVLGKVQTGAIVFKYPAHPNNISIEILSAKSKIKPELSGGNPRITLKIDVHSNIGEAMIPINVATPRENGKLEKLTEEVIRKEIQSALAKARRFNTDFFGFGEAFHRKRPNDWKRLGQSWDRLFPELPVQIEVNSVIRRVGKITKIPIFH